MRTSSKQKADDGYRRRVSAALPAPHPAARLRAHSLLRLPCQPAAPQLLPLCRQLLKSCPPQPSPTQTTSDIQMRLALPATAAVPWPSSKSSLLNRSAGDLLSGRAFRTRRSCHPSPEPPLAPARTPDVCPKRPESQNAAQKSTFRKHEPAFSALPAPSSRREPPRHSPYRMRPIFLVDSTPIALPRPPQTRAASFKRLYPK